MQEQTKLAKDLAESLDATVKKGEASKIDAVQARLQAMRFHTQAASLDAEEQQALAVLNPLLGMDASKPIYVSGSLPPIEIPDAGAAEIRPALQVARLEAISADQTTALERANRLSDVSVGIVAGMERNLDVPVGFENERIIGLQLSIPLPLWNKNQGNIDAASAFAERKDKELLAFRQKMLLELQATHAEMADWTKLVADIETELLPLAKEQCELTEAAQRNGQAQWLDVFRCREQLLSTAISRLDAIENFHLARSRYKTILGNQ